MLSKNTNQNVILNKRKFRKCVLGLDFKSKNVIEIKYKTELA
jgi:hypothetical protein